jgi:hypothetical protein
VAFERTASTVDEIAIAPYVGVAGANPFDPAEAGVIASMTSGDLFTSLDTALETEVRPWIEDHLSLSDRFGKPLVAYEGGQHLAGDPSNDALTELFVAANRDARMGDLYDRFLAAWKEMTGNALFVHFTDSGPYERFGSWGAVESPDALPLTASPKYAALEAYASGP